MVGRSAPSRKFLYVERSPATVAADSVPNTRNAAKAFKRARPFASRACHTALSSGASHCNATGVDTCCPLASPFSMHASLQRHLLLRRFAGERVADPKARESDVRR